MSEINRNFMSEAFTPKKDAEREQLKEAVEKFLRRNGHTMTASLVWTDALELTFMPNCANSRYTLAIAMLQALFTDTTYGYIAYREDSYGSFSMCFTKHNKSIAQHIEYINRAEVNVTLRYKGELI